MRRSSPLSKYKAVLANAVTYGGTARRVADKDVAFAPLHVYLLPPSRHGKDLYLVAQSAVCENGKKGGSTAPPNPTRTKIGAKGKRSCHASSRACSLKISEISGVYRGIQMRYAMRLTKYVSHTFCWHLELCLGSIPRAVESRHF